MTILRRTSHRHRLVLAGPAVALSLVLAACGGGGDDDKGTSAGAGSAPACKPSDGPVQLTFSTWVPGMEEVVKLWNADNPDIQVKVNSVPAGNAGTYQNFTNALKAGTAPDLGQVEYDSLPNFRLQEGLTDISGCPGIAEAEQKFVPWTWSQVDFNGSGGVYAIPQDTGPMALYYRKDIFDKLGLAAPTTWEEYAAAAKTIHDADPSQYITFFSQTDPNWYTGLYWQAGAQLFTNDGDAIGVDIEGNPAVEKVNDYWQGLIDDDLVAGNLQGFSEELYKAWNTGKVVSWVSAAWGYSTIRDNAPDTAGKWAVAPMPQWDAGGTAAGNWGGSSTAVLAGSDHPAEAAQFALWLNTDPEALALENKLGGLYPSSVDGLDIEALQQGVDFYGGQTIFDVFKQASAGVDPSFTWGPTMTDTYAALKDGIVGALSGNGTLDDATKDAQAKTVASLEAQSVPVAD
ncbi:ABC transporter substrate-binding protein [Nocardioides rubriscoriae]|uniref:ABC transporter substrate-binding protein n=1 Tax=Nocardioides rubriscoriae TaxID=642762 RepID=UPI0011E06E81|nr:sugar ABC transporter substrate-binding protein [Nocardioides rubriscoriae]